VLFVVHYFVVKGHPFMTSTHSGRGQAMVDACGWGAVVWSMWMSTRKIKAQWHHPLLFSCKDHCTICFKSYVYFMSTAYGRWQGGVSLMQTHMDRGWSQNL